MKWTESKSKIQTEYFAEDKSRSAEERSACVDEFLSEALDRIGKAYDYKNCPAILFDLIHNGAIRVNDLPDGAKLTYSEKVWCQLIQPEYSKALVGTLDSISSEFGVESPEFENAGIEFYRRTIEAIKESLTVGESSKIIKEYSPATIAIVILDGSDRLAHNAISGKRIAFNGKKIESESTKNCQCEYCISG